MTTFKTLDAFNVKAPSMVLIISEPVKVRVQRKVLERKQVESSYSVCENIDSSVEHLGLEAAVNQVRKPKHISVLNTEHDLINGFTVNFRNEPIDFFPN